MGYDFSFIRLSRPPKSYPSHGEDVGPDIGRFDPREVEALLTARGYCDERLEWRTPDNGSLSLRVSDDWISVDTHAHWKYVHELYECVRRLYPDVVLVDPQKGLLHDGASFAAFVDASYARKR